jgi:hypothetical protein
MFTDAEKKAFEDEHIKNAFKVIGEYRIYLSWGNIGYQDIKIRLEQSTSGTVHFAQSHYIKTPLQGGPYMTSVSYADNAENALHKAVGTIMDWYGKAIKEGHEPSGKWFKPNEHY